VCESEGVHTDHADELWNDHDQVNPVAKWFLSHCWKDQSIRDVKMFMRSIELPTVMLLCYVVEEGLNYLVCREMKSDPGAGS
jgi:hypothetical protein